VAYDEDLAGRVRTLLRDRHDVDERRMFGGIGYLVAGNMCCGVHGEQLIVRLDPAEADELIGSERGARPFDLTGRPMRGWLFVDPVATAEEDDLARWVRRGEAFAATLPPK
jgi:TfoX/Sxy family transcriptional regulator of competence genes